MTFETDKSFRRTTKLVKLVNQDVNNRFGVSQNYDDEVYRIHLRFSDVTGKFVHEQNWHHTQTITEVTGPGGKKNYDITFWCGINRELVGWLFQWMSNVKVLGPPQLVALYRQQLAMIQRTAESDTDGPIEYSNIFAPDS